MKIFSAAQIREWDRYTMLHEPISSIDLMERAAKACVKEILTLIPSHSQLVVLTGPGNNGGDGLAIARALRNHGYDVTVFHPIPGTGSDDNEVNLGRWQAEGGTTLPLTSFLTRTVNDGDVIIDALLGTGTNRPATGLYKEVIAKVNAGKANVISIDIPSGMFADEPSDLSAIIRARYTLTFQQMKLAFLLPSTGPFCGEIRVLDIGLSRRFYEQTECSFELTERDDARAMVRPREKFSHKGDYGTLLMFAGRKGMMGAAIMAARASFRAGVGKLVCRIPSGALDIMQTSVPEAICLPDGNEEMLEHLPPLDGYHAIAVGPGIGTGEATAALVGELMDHAGVPMVMDADALNLIASRGWLNKLRKGMVITPHPGEFRRLLGDFGTDQERLRACLGLSTSREICVILKGRYTFLSTPGGKGYFNSTGNPGLAKAGSGDVLTGIIAAFLAQKYSTDAACRLGTYVHGLAGDMASMLYGEAGLMPSDTIDLIGKAIEAI